VTSATPESTSGEPLRHPLYRVLVIGGYGFFGGLLVERLARQAELHILVAGRRLEPARALVARLGEGAAARLEPIALDASSAGLADELRRHAADVVVDASGPFQHRDYRVAQACIAAGAHYIDLADGREFVVGIGALDAAARAAGLSVISGASSVPALSSAVVDWLARGSERVLAIDIGISPGNRTERGLSTIRAVLSYCGKRLPDAGAGPTYGWIGTRRHAYPQPVGERLLSPCDVPDLVLLPGRYPGSPAVRFGAGLELAVLHRGINAMAWIARLGLVRDWSAHAGWLKRAADRFRNRGTDAGAMHVGVTGVDAAGRASLRTWRLIATDGHGPYVPTLAADALIRRLVRGPALPAGATPCVGLLALADFEQSARGLAIRMAEVPR
jgi:hypothetical protein